MTNNPLYQAAMARAKAQEQTALSTLGIYFTKAVAIGEHPDFATEIDKYVDLLSQATDRIEALNKVARLAANEEGE